ncbi:hypothetical protein P3L10_022196 [Capsicum annuum]
MSFSTLEHQFMMQSYPFMTCILRVKNRSSGWQKTVSKIFKNVYGINFRMNGGGMIEVSGNVDPKLLLKGLAKAGRKAELCWLQFGECSNNLFINQSDYYYGGQLGGHLDGRILHYGDINTQLNQRSKNNFRFFDRGTKYECTVAAAAARAHERSHGRSECTVAAEARARECRRRAAVADEGVSSCCMM